MNINDNDYIKEIAEDVKENPETSFRLFKRFLPLGVMIVMAGLLWLYFIKSEHGAAPVQSESIPTAPSVPNTLDSAGQAATALWTQTLGDNIELTLPNGEKLAVPQNGFEKSLLTYLTDGCQGDIKSTWFNCDRLLFQTGSAELNAASHDQMSDLANLMKAFPTSSFKIGGYTDNTGDAAINKKISGERASAVMNALIERGVSAALLSAEGYGPEHPICPENDSEDCRAKNRRVSIRVVNCK